MLQVSDLTLGFSVFDEHDYYQTFQKFDKDGSGTISKQEVEELLFETYGFPPIQDEVDLFMEEFDANHDGKISWEEFVDAIKRIKERMDMKAERAKEYKSFEKMKTDRFKHKRMEVEPQDKFKGPVTMNQSIGFMYNDETL